jgi:hypothetical protein
MIVHRGATVGDRESMAWMPAYIAVGNLLSMISIYEAHYLILVGLQHVDFLT